MGDRPKLLRVRRRGYRVALRLIVFRVKLEGLQKHPGVVGQVVVAIVVEVQAVAIVVGYRFVRVVWSNSELGDGLGLLAHRIQGRTL